MDIRRLQGYALIGAGVIGLLALVGQGGTFFQILFILGALLLIFGVPAIEAVDRSGPIGVIGIVLIELGALIALALNLMSFGGPAAVGMGLLLASALAGGAGRVIIGWLTARNRTFAPWIGWAFLIEGVLNFVGGIIEIDVLAPLFTVAVPIIGAAAVIGYGLQIARREARA